MRVRVTGTESITGKTVVRELLAAGHSIREHNGLITDENAVRLCRFVDLVVHADWLWAAPSFEAEVEHNLQGSIRLAAACEEHGVPLQYAIDFDPNRSIAMAIQVLKDEYHATRFWTDGL